MLPFLTARVEEPRQVVLVVDGLGGGVSAGSLMPTCDTEVGELWSGFAVDGVVLERLVVLE